MRQFFTRFFDSPMSRPALIAPTMVMLIFSIFTLTAPTDPIRTAGAITLGIVNQDAGVPMPPVKVSERMLSGLSGQMPFQTKAFEDRATAEADLAAGFVSVVLVFPEDFSQKALQSDQATFEILTSQHLTIAEVQIAAQLQQMLPAAMSAGVASIKLAMAKGQMPTGQMPVAATVTSLTPPEKPTAMQAPFAMLYTTWLAAIAGASTLILATRGRMDRGGAALSRALFPILSTGIASLILSIIVAATVGWGVMLPVWGVVWPSALAITWLFTGVVAVLGFWTIVLLVPLAFYQSALGGVMAPASAAPEWLQTLLGWVPFDGLGAAYRGAVHGIDMPYPLALIGTFAIVGLVLIWIKSMLPAQQPKGQSAQQVA